MIKVSLSIDASSGSARKGASFGATSTPSLASSSDVCAYADATDSTIEMGPSKIPVRARIGLVRS